MIQHSREFDYGHGIGTLLLPSGQQLAVAQDEQHLELNGVLARMTLEEWMSSKEALDYLTSAGVPSASFPEIGSVHKGKITDYEKVQQRDIASGTPKTYDNGDPMWQIVITIATDERSDEIEDDDGTRKLYAKGNMLAAIREALKASGHKGDIIGGTIAVKYVKDGVPTRAGFTAPKEFLAQFEAPVQTEVFDGEGFDQDPF